MNEFDEFFAELKLYGDDFSLEEIEQWYEDEKEAYSELGSKDRGQYCYSYHALNVIHGYRYLPDRIFKPVLSIGGAYGDELIPIYHKIEDIFILEPSEQLRQPFLKVKPLHYINPNIEGKLPFPDNYFELIICLGVLHHIPNVSFVMTEIYRVLKREGFLLLREPIISMGDWRKPRRGLTKRERGIPFEIMKNIILDCGFSIQKCSPYMFSFTSKLNFLIKAPFNSKIIVKLDAFLSNLFRFNQRYHRVKIWEKIGPWSFFWVLRK